MKDETWDACETWPLAEAWNRCSKGPLRAGWTLWRPKVQILATLPRGAERRLLTASTKFSVEQEKNAVISARGWSTPRAITRATLRGPSCW